MKLLIALAGSNLVVFLFGLEVLGRLLDPLGISYYPETARFFDRLLLEEPIGYRLPPNFTGRFWGVTVQTNSLGMRDRELPARKPQGEFRVMLLGDSAVFSLGVEYEASIPAQLERELNASAPRGRRYRTLNMGVPSYNTEQELVQLESVGLRLDPDAVVLYFALNDIEPRLWVFEKRRNPIADWAQRSYAASIAFSLARRVLSLVHEAPPQIQYTSFRADSPRWQAIEGSLRRIAALLRERGIPFLLVSAGPDDSPHMRLLREVGASAGFTVARLDGKTDPQWAANPARFVNSPTDGHCNPAGCRILAAHIARLLRESGSL
jgi:hypothetical protein